MFFQRETIRNHIIFFKDKFKTHWFIITYLALYSIFLFFISVLNPYYDGDTFNLMRHLKANGFSWGNLLSFSLLQAPIALIISFFLQTDYIMSAFLFGLFTLALTILSIYITCFIFVKSKIIASLSAIMYSIFRCVWILHLFADDNVISVPFVFISIILLFISMKLPAKDDYWAKSSLLLTLASISLGVAILAHLQSIIFLPVIFLGIVLEDKDRAVKVKRLIFSAVIVLGVWLPFLTLNFIERGLKVPESFFSIENYTYQHLSNTQHLSQNYSIFSHNLTRLNEIINWIIGFVQGAGLSFFFGIHQSQYTDYNPVRLIFHVYAWILLLIALVPILGIFRWKEKKDLEKFQILCALAILSGLMYVLVYEPNVTERWIHIFPFIAFNLSIFIYPLSFSELRSNYVPLTSSFLKNIRKNFTQTVLSALRSEKSRNALYLFVYLLLCLVIIFSIVFMVLFNLFLPLGP